jgi:hypothetical protein
MSAFAWVLYDPAEEAFVNADVGAVWDGEG